MINPGYSFAMGLEPVDDPCPEFVMSFLKTVETVFHITSWKNIHTQEIIEISHDELKSYAELSTVKKHISKLGYSWGISNATPADLHLLSNFSTGHGTMQKTNSAAFVLLNPQPLPDLQPFRELIEATRPRNASFRSPAEYPEVRELLNEKPTVPYTDRPRGIEWWTYFRQDRIDLLGGTEHCLNTPCYRVEEFCEGILFQVTETPFEEGNTSHLLAQLQVMKHLRMP